MRVFVYYNLHRSDWSIMKNGLVIGHAKELTLKECEFLVRQAGRQRVVKEQRKNVHAFVIGDMVSKKISEPKHGLSTRISYNPYKNKTFKAVDQKKSIYRAGTVCFYKDRTVMAWE